MRLNHDIEPDYGQGGESRGRTWSVGRVFGVGEDPLTWWSFPLMKVGGLRVRVHTFLVPVWMGIEALAWLPQNKLGPVHLLSAMGALLVLALLHELGRGLFARWLGDGGDCVVVWPLGGLNPVARRGAAYPLAAESGGLVVNALLVPVLALAALGLGISHSELFFNPLEVNAAAANLNSLPQIVVWWAYFMNAFMLAANLLLPMLPLDSGRLVNAWLRGRSNTPAETAAKIGFVTAGVLFLVSTAVGQGHLMGVAVLGAVATLIERRRHVLPVADVYDLDPVIPEEPPPPSPRRPAPPPPTAELDAVLEKISKQGINSLTSAEREVLARETERRRRG
jgi:Zn-dependent protease